MEGVDYNLLQSGAQAEQVAHRGNAAPTDVRDMQMPTDKRIKKEDAPLLPPVDERRGDYKRNGQAVGSDSTGPKRLRHAGAEDHDLFGEFYEGPMEYEDDWQDWNDAPAPIDDMEETPAEPDTGMSTELAFPEPVNLITRNKCIRGKDLSASRKLS